MLSNKNPLFAKIPVDDKEQQHSWVLLLSIILSIIAAQLINNGRLGLNYIVFNSLCIATLIFLRHKFQQTITKNEYMLLSGGAIISLFLVFRQSEVLYSLNILAILLLLAIAFAQSYSTSLLNIPMIAWLLSPLSILRLCAVSILRLINFGLINVGLKSPFNLSHRQKHIKSVFLGLLWAAPVLWLFGSLLVSSDSRFEQFTMGIFSFDFIEISDELLQILLYLPFISAFFYAGTLLSIWHSTSSIDAYKESRLSMEGVQIMTILSAVNILFLSYILVQFSYFFGGEQLVLSSKNLSYSGYARRGFWELITLAVIVLPLLLSTHWLQRQEPEPLQVWFKRLAIVMVICLVIIEISAIHRMMLYVSMYGLTELRFYSSVFMLYMMLVLLTFCFCIIKNKRGEFIFYMTLQAIAVIVLLNIINPDARISEYNIAHNKDSKYIKYLSTDAYPSIYNNETAFDPFTYCLLKKDLNTRLDRVIRKSYQWNWSVEQAVELMVSWQEKCSKP